MQGFQFPTCSLGLGPTGRDAEPGRAVLQLRGLLGGRGWQGGSTRKMLLTHGPRLKMAVTVSREHTQPILGELTRGTPAARLAACWAWQARTAKGQVLAGVRTGLPTG